MLTGSFGRRGTNQLHTWLAPCGQFQNKVYAPTGDEIIGGLLPPNSFPRAVLIGPSGALACPVRR